MNDHEDNEEIINLKREINQHSKDLELMKQKKKNINLVVDQVQNWAGKVMTQVSDQYLDPDIESNLSDQFKTIEKLVSVHL